MSIGLVLEGGRWMSQERMIRAMGDKDMETFHLFYRDTVRPVYSFILSSARNPEEAGDVIQDTYLTVQTKAGSYVPQSKPLTWVFTIARNPCYMRFREQKMKASVALKGLAEDEEGEYCVLLEQVVDRKVLLDAPGQTSCEERQIVLLHTAASMKHQEVAEALQMSLVTVLPKYNRSMKKFQELSRCSRWDNGAGIEKG